jgi:hypothetical protein
VTSGFQVVLADLRRTAGAFGTESVTFWGIMPPDGPESVSGGSPEFDGALAQVLEAIGGRHTELAAAIAGHGRKLREAYKNYQTAEETVGHMVDRIMDHGAPG